MERRSNLLTYVALAWLGAFVLMAHAGISVPDGFRLAILVLTFWSLGYLYYRLCRRWPLAGFLGFGFIVGLFGGGYQSSATTVVEYDDGERIDHDCDGN